MKKLVIVLTLGIGYLTPVIAQEVKNRKNEIGIQFDFLQTYYKDLNFSPLNNKGSGIGLGINYKHNTNRKHIFFSSLNLSESTIKSKASEFFKYKRYFINSEIGFLFYTPTKNENLKLNIGGSYQNTIDFLSYKGLNAVSFFNYHGVALNATLETSINDKNSWGTTLGIPVFSFLTRPPYMGWDKFMIENRSNMLKFLFRSKAGSLNQILAFDWQLFYKYELSKRIAIKAQYRLNYKRTSVPEKAIIATNQTSIELIFKF